MTAAKIKAVAILSIAIAFCAAFAIGQYRADRMDKYAKANNCKWVYSAYIDREPICK